MISAGRCGILISRVIGRMNNGTRGTITSGPNARPRIAISAKKMGLVTRIRGSSGTKKGKNGKEIIISWGKKSTMRGTRTGTMEVIRIGIGFVIRIRGSSSGRKGTIDKSKPKPSILKYFLLSFS